VGVHVSPREGNKRATEEKVERRVKDGGCGRERRKKDVGCGRERRKKLLKNTLVGKAVALVSLNNN
jgi:hypothetical protein